MSINLYGIEVGNVATCYVCEANAARIGENNILDYLAMISPAIYKCARWESRNYWIYWPEEHQLRFQRC